MDSTRINETTPSHVISTVFESWSSSYDDDDSHLPDDEDFIASLLVDDNDDLSLLHDPEQDLKLDDKQGLSPTSVRDFDKLLRAPKRLKVLNVDIDVPPLPTPVKRESWNRPVCTFLNFFGSRMVYEPTTKIETVKKPPAVARAFVPSCKPTLAPTPEILFPVCPCKLKHVIHGGANAIAPPILQLLSKTSICKPVASPSPAPPVATMPGDTQDEKDETGSQVDVDEFDAAEEVEYDEGK
jgi:hypothetical protein